MPHLPTRLKKTQGTLHLPTTAYADMLQEAWRTYPHETGGILLGTDHGDHHNVLTVIGPGPNATHTRYRFAPDSQWQATQVATAWQQNQHLEYLGDWHTHPNGTTRFSQLDLDTAQTIANAPQARQPHPIMVVIAPSNDSTVRTAAARLHRDRLAPLGLVVHSESGSAEEHR